MSLKKMYTHFELSSKRCLLPCLTLKDIDKIVFADTNLLPLHLKMDKFMFSTENIQYQKYFDHLGIIHIVSYSIH